MGKIYVTGDTHGDWSRFEPFNFDGSSLAKDDFVVVLGDFGLWHDTDDQRKQLDELNGRNFTTLFIDGNHENFDRLNSGEFPEVDFHGGRAHQIREHIFHLMRGYVFNLCGQKIFCFGGAKSHDIADGILDEKDFPDASSFLAEYTGWKNSGKYFRVNHASWWKEELPSEEEMERGIQSLSDSNWEVDYVFSHCLPQDAASAGGFFDPDVETMYFNSLLLDHKLRFKKWYCGHYHKELSIMGKFQILYYRIERIV